MIDLRRRGEGASSFDIGVGQLYDIDVQVLGDDFVANSPPPGQERQVRFRRESQRGLLVMTSYSF